MSLVDKLLESAGSGHDVYEEMADAYRNNKEPVEYITIPAAAQAAREWFAGQALDWQPFPEQKPVAEPADSQFSLSVLVETGEGYAVAYYSYENKEWLMDDSAAGVQTMLFIPGVRRWAYLPGKKL